MLLWNGNKLKITAGFIPRYFWTTASIDVFVNGRRILATGGPFQRTGICDGRFSEDRGLHNIRLEWGKADWRHFPYKLLIDDVVVAESRVYIRNWPLLMIPYTSFIAASVLLQHYLLFHHF